VEAGGTRYEVHQCAAKPTENPSRSEGTQEQREAAASASLAFPPLQPTPSRRRRHRPRHRRPGVDLSASLVAALERISINEPEMAAGSSSSAGGDGLSLLSHCADPNSLTVLPSGFLRREAALENEAELDEN